MVALPPGASLPRRLGALLYDGILLFGVLFAANLALLPFIGVADPRRPHPLLSLYDLSVIYLFNAWFWTHGGQTLGMKTWKLVLVTEDGRPVGWARATLRFLAACLSFAALGLGWLWIPFDRDRLAWHDRLSRTRVVRIG
ncbi:MAG: RDD family protein [Gammaproteobacteria bacterium]|nr:MAG: RDD family protein [Gammaproteobacteria bacterium]